MTQLLEKPAGQRLIHSGHTWEQFKLIQKGFEGFPGVRLAYYDGTIEIRMPGRDHEMFSRFINYLVKTLPENQAAEVLDFVEFLRQKARLQSEGLPLGAIPQGTLTGLRGIAKRSGTPPTDADLQEEYTDYLSQKYQ